jgi:hypothetical protein
VRLTRIDRIVRALVAFAAIWQVAGCAGPWDVEALEARRPALAKLSGHRLGDATPYLLARDGELVLFLCRFESGQQLRVSLPEDASDEEARLLLRALAAWSGAGLGVSLLAVAPGEPAEIVIRIGGAAQGFTAQTAADCALGDPAISRHVLEARLVGAQISLRREDEDVRGHRIPLSPEEFLGSSVHELGHALGFQGHARGSGSVMVRNVEAVRRTGRRLLAGEAFWDATLEALYRVESGIVVGRSPLPEGRTDPIDRLFAIAETHGMVGPVVRVGDHSARISWWDADALRLSVHVPRLPAVLLDPNTLRLQPGPYADAWLRGSERAPRRGSGRVGVPSR